MKAWTAHYNSELAKRDTSIIDMLPDHMQRPDVWLVGSFCEPTGESKATLAGVLLQLQDSQLPFRVRLACVDAANTAAAGGPRALHLTMGCVSGGATESANASPAGFVDRGPELPRRFAHDHLDAGSSSGSAGGRLRNIVDTATARLRIPGLRCRRLSPLYIQYYAAQLELPDAVFLQKSSTSPKYEPLNFVQDVKEAYRYIVSQAEAKVTHVADACFEWVDEAATAAGAGEDGEGHALGGWRPVV
ncbi:Protein N-terminal asparagine amidohydrolase [Pleodorina starrii]|nr:Protein N-terminal asparagine amidohydrolase [Pleodorina starrii]GLC63658.1 Protein N-terminal asparagine amidohydrolase [Pleodorina starrii]